MKIIFITQDEPFYLGRHFDTLLSDLPDWVSVAGVVLLDPSPFKPEPFWKKVKKTYRVFGPAFFIRYSLKYLKAKCFRRRYLLRNVLKRHGIPEVELPKKSVNAEASLQTLAAFSPDLLVGIQANQIFKKDLLNLPGRGCLNLHTALLPKYKGLMPAFWALKNDEKETGVSVFFMDEGIDTGEIIVQRKVPIVPTDTLEKLINKTKKEGMEAVIQALSLIQSNAYTTLKFSSGEGSYFSFPNRKDVKEFIHAGKRFW